MELSFPVRTGGGLRDLAVRVGMRNSQVMEYADLHRKVDAL